MLMPELQTLIDPVVAEALREVAARIDSDERVFDAFGAVISNPE
jgi:hypothetical protein